MHSVMLAALILSPIYFWSSGLPQLSHGVAIVAIGLRVVLKPWLYWERWWGLGLAFIMYASFVALLVFAIYGDLWTLLAPASYAFGFLIFVLLVNFCRESRTFLTKIYWIHLVALVVLTTLSVMGIGDLFEEFRTVVAFNDPNQMANWILWTTIIIAVTGKALYISWLPGLFGLVVASVGIAFTASRSGGLGLFALLVVYLLMGFYTVFYSRLNVTRIRVALLVVLGVFILALVLSWSGMSTLGEHAQGVSNQVVAWLSRFTEGGPDASFAGRGYDRIWKFPEYLVFGAGEGAHDRFAERTEFLGEIHSSWAGLLFNYGLVGFFLFFAFIYMLLRRVGDMWFKLMLLGPFMYGFATYSIRNWYFWVGLALVYSSWYMLKERQLQGKADKSLESRPRMGLEPCGNQLSNL